MWGAILAAAAPSLIGSGLNAIFGGHRTSPQERRAYENLKSMQFAPSTAAQRMLQASADQSGRQALGMAASLPTRNPIAAIRTAMSQNEQTQARARAQAGILRANEDARIQQMNMQREQALLGYGMQKSDQDRQNREQVLAGIHTGLAAGADAFKEQNAAAGKGVAGQGQALSQGTPGTFRATGAPTVNQDGRLAGEGVAGQQQGLAVAPPGATPNRSFAEELMQWNLAHNPRTVGVPQNYDSEAAWMLPRGPY